MAAAMRIQGLDRVQLAMPFLTSKSLRIWQRWANADLNTATKSRPRDGDSGLACLMKAGQVAAHTAVDIDPACAVLPKRLAFTFFSI